MTQLLNGTGVNAGLSAVLAEDDDRLKPEYVTLKNSAVVIRDTAKDASGLSYFGNAWWPGMGIGGILGDSGDVTPRVAIWNDLPEVTRGANMVYYFTGYARNAAGTPTSGVTLKLYLTSTDQVVSTTTSNPDGSYTLPTSYGGQGHYIVAYLSGGGTTPDLEGTTINTLVPGVPGA